MFLLHIFAYCDRGNFKLVPVRNLFSSVRLLILLLHEFKTEQRSASENPFTQAPAEQLNVISLKLILSHKKMIFHVQQSFPLCVCRWCWILDWLPSWCPTSQSQLKAAEDRMLSCKDQRCLCFLSQSLPWEHEHIKRMALSFSFSSLNCSFTSVCQISVQS